MAYKQSVTRSPIQAKDLSSFTYKIYHCLLIQVLISNDFFNYDTL